MQWEMENGNTLENPTNSKDQQLLNHLSNLGEEYYNLCTKEKNLVSLLDRLKDEERCLLSSIELADQSSSSTTRQSSNSKQDQERQAMKRLEEALMEDSSSSSSSDEEEQGTGSGK